MPVPSVIVGDANFLRATERPPEHDAPLVVDTDAVQTGEVPAKHFQSIAWWRAQIVEVRSVVEHVELPGSDGAHRRPRNALPYSSRPEECLGRVIRDIGRKIEANGVLEVAFAKLLR